MSSYYDIGDVIVVIFILVAGTYFILLLRKVVKMLGEILSLLKKRM